MFSVVVYGSTFFASGRFDFCRTFLCGFCIFVDTEFSCGAECAGQQVFVSEIEADA